MLLVILYGTYLRLSYYTVPIYALLYYTVPKYPGFYPCLFALFLPG